MPERETLFLMNKNIFDTIGDAATSSESLTQWLDTGMWQLFEVYNASHDEIAPLSRDIDHFVQLHRNTLTGLDYNIPHVRAFLLILLALCERLGIYGAIPHLLSIVKDNSIAISSRMKAGISLVYPRPTTSDSLFNLFDTICPLLQEAVETEEDDSRASLITFLNYCSAVARDTDAGYTRRLRDKISDAVKHGRYPFIIEIKSILDFDWDNPDSLLASLQGLIDTTSAKSLDIICSVDTAESLIERDSDYAATLQGINADFDEIRAISVSLDDNRDNTGRGVRIIESENALYNYMKRFGNMHRAKINSALEPPFPREFPSRINLVDWGCGQGIASMVFLEKFTGTHVARLLLIEPSEISLSRAALHCRHYAPDLPIRTICKELDQLVPGDFTMLSEHTTVHLFSNILDIDDYSPRHLLDLIGESFHGLNYFVCVSPDVSEINTAKFRSFAGHFEKYNATFARLNHASDTKYGRYWCCNNTYRNGGRVNHGSHFGCADYSPSHGCHHKWTRIMDVFSVRI